MRAIAVFFLAVLLVLSGQRPALAQFNSGAGGDPDAHHTQVRLLLSAITAQPGDTIFAGVDMKMDPGWHTYWKNPGDAGTATKIDWKLPPGVTAGDIEWPLPRKLPPAEVTTYGYEDEVMLVVPLTLASNLSPGTVNLSAKVSWLECKDSCIPADQEVTAKIDVGAETKTSPDAAAISLWRSKTPQTNSAYVFVAAWEKSTNADTRSLLISHAESGAWKNVKFDSVDFFPAASDNFEVQPATEILSTTTADIRLRKTVKKLSGDWPKEISGTIVIESGKMRSGYDVTLPIAEHAASPAATATAATPALLPVPAPPLWQTLLYAFIGGLVLNIMPCVLPVIALKILGFVSEARSEPRRIRKLGFCYTFGVLVSFLVLAAILIGIRAAGHHIGWGMQFSSPVFIVCLTTLVLLVALNLFGVFEVTLGGRALDTASGLASQGGAAGAFFNGALATTLATPCAAPFLAPALGFAFAASSPVILLVLLTVGLGLSAPYLLLSFQPAWLRFLPKPGAWMEKFKIGMGFPMLATVVWLFNVAASSYGDNVLWLGVFLVLVAFAAWIFGEFVQRGRRHPVAAAIIALLLLAGSYAFALEKELNWRAAVFSTAPGTLKESADGIDWQPWSSEAVTAARAAGKPVLVDFTARWCVTCQLNKISSLEVPSVREELKADHVVALLGDYTHFPDAITAELNRYQRAAVPLVLVFPKKADAPAIVLPSLLTPGIVLSALEQAK
jgi:thiol:disulfide interchange protein DsbD